MQTIRRGGGSEGGREGGGGGFSRTLPPPRVPLWSPPKGGRKILKRKSSAPKQNFGCQPQTLQEEEGWGEGVQGEGGRGGQGRYPPSYYGAQPF